MWGWRKIRITLQMQRQIKFRKIRIATISVRMVKWTTHRTGESEPRPTSGPQVAPRVGPRVAPRVRPREPPREHPRGLISLFWTPHETSHEGVHGRAHEWTVGVHLSCFHLFCSVRMVKPPQNLQENSTNTPRIPKIAVLWVCLWRDVHDLAISGTLAIKIRKGWNRHPSTNESLI